MDNLFLPQPKPLFIAGPCVIESEDLVLQVAEHLALLKEKWQVPMVFKSSFDKANRTALHAKRGPGLQEALRILDKVHRQFGLPILTDVHETHQVEAVAEVAHVLQIPAFLCRQTDLIMAAGATGRIVNIKKGQFLAPESMAHAKQKADAAGAAQVWLTERGTTFGYHDLVVDFRNLPIMRAFGPVIFDVTHSVQQPGGQGDRSGGNRAMAIYLAKAAAAVGVDGFFIETHPNPDTAWSDGPNMIPLAGFESFIESLLRIHALGS